jgi:sugar lactone lactonase YvrE
MGLQEGVGRSRASKGVSRRSAAAIALAAGLIVALAGAAHAAPVGGLGFKHCIEDNDGAPDTCAPAVDGLGGADAIAISPDLRSAYLVSLGDNALVRLDRNRATGELSFGQCFDDDISGTEAACPAVPAMTNPNGVLVSPDGRFVYALSPNDVGISRFARNPKTGALTYQGCLMEIGGGAGCTQTIPVLSNPRAFAISPDGLSVYVGDESANAVIRLDRNRATGALSYAGCVDDDGDCPAVIDGLSQVSDVEVAPDGRAVYAVGASDEAVTSFSRNRSSGAIARAGCLQQSGGSVTDCAQVDGLHSVEYVEASADGRSVYLAGYELARLKRNRASGALSFGQCFRRPGAVDPACAPIDGLNQLFGLALSPDDRSVLAVAGAGDALLNFARNPRTGALSPQGCFDDDDTGSSSCPGVPGLREASGVTVSGDGRSVYTTSHLDDAVGIFSRLPMRCDGRPGTVYGTPFKDALVGTGGADVFIAGAGADRVKGKGGRDRACGGRGRDRLAGGAGRDVLFGQAGPDLLLGGRGPDLLLGGRGRDRLRGGPGRDRLRGGPGRDRQRQ